MKCELCHQNNAETVLYRKGKGDRQEELYVCKACAERERAFDENRGINVATMETDTPPRGNPGKFPIDPEALGMPPKEVLGQLSEMFGQLSEKLDPEQHNEGNCCPKCGTSVDDLRAGHLVGCPTCYETFAELFATLLEELQGGSEYGGEPYPGRERERRIKALKTALKTAVDKEDYTEAAKIRRELKALEDEEGEAHV